MAISAAVNALRKIAAETNSKSLGPVVGLINKVLVNEAKEPVVVSVTAVPAVPFK